MFRKLFAFTTIPALLATSAVAQQTQTAANAAVTAGLLNRPISAAGLIGVLQQMNAYTASVQQQVTGSPPYGGITTPAAPYNYGPGVEQYLFRYSNSNFNGIDVYNEFYGTDTKPSNFDNLQSVVAVPSNTTINQVTSYAAYGRNMAAGGTLGPNLVGYFASMTAEGQSARSWGINTLLQDAAARSVGTDSGKFLLNEYDFNVMNPNTTVIGSSVGGNSLAQPAVAQGYVVNVLGTVKGVPVQWATCAFCSQAGAATTGLALGATNTSGTNIPSQSVLLGWFNGQGSSEATIINMQNGYLVAQSNGPWSGLKINSGSIGLDAGQAFQIAGNNALSGSSSGDVTLGNSGHYTTLNGMLLSNLYTPATSSASCTAGQIADDANYHYVCTAPNTWKRVALSAF